MDMAKKCDCSILGKFLYLKFYWKLLFNSFGWWKKVYSQLWLKMWSHGFGKILIFLFLKIIKILCFTEKWDLMVLLEKYFLHCWLENILVFVFGRKNTILTENMILWIWSKIWFYGFNWICFLNFVMTKFILELEKKINFNVSFG